MRTGKMAQLILVRHGQASFGTDNYDRLSELGRRQARATGRALRRAGVTPSKSYSGTMERQRHTADLALEEIGGDTGFDALRSFDEYDSTGVFTNYLPEVLDLHPDIRDRVTPDDYSALREPAIFRRIFYPVMNRWIAGERATRTELEPWDDFCQRVVNGVDQVADSLAERESAVVFTSGGVISVVLAHALGLEWARSIDFNWRTANGSITRLAVTERGFALDGYNHFAHLEDAAAGLKVTYI